MDGQPAFQEEAATATNLTGENSNPEQDGAVFSLGLGTSPQPESVLVYFATLQLQVVNPSPESREEEEAENGSRGPEEQQSFKLPKIYVCDYCNKIFHSSEYYCRHLRRHVNLWRCKKCNHGFKYFDEKIRHQKICLRPRKERLRMYYAE